MLATVAITILKNLNIILMVMRLLLVVMTKIAFMLTTFVIKVVIVALPLPMSGSVIAPA